MNSCNLRGFMLLSGNKATLMKDCRTSLTRCTDGFIFSFNENFDTFQNGVFDVGNKKEYEVYLKNDSRNINILLGTTQYKIFPNTVVPLSYPYFSFLMPGSYLFVKTGSDYPVVYLTYDAGILDESLKTPKETIYAYHSEYNLDRDLYRYNHIDNVHRPIIKDIRYCSE